MSFLDRMGVTTSEELHALIAARTGTPATLEMVATLEAAHNATVAMVPGETPDAFLHDPYLVRAVASAVNTADENRGFDPVPEPGRAIVVLSNDLGTGAEHSWALGNDISIDARLWWYVSDHPDRVTSNEDRCHRCTGPWAKGPITNPAIGSFRIARGRYVVEFALCSDCMAHYALMFEKVTERTIHEVGGYRIPLETPINLNPEEPPEA